MLDLIVGAGVGYGAGFLFTRGETSILRDSLFKAQLRVIEAEAELSKEKSETARLRSEMVAQRKTLESIQKRKIAFGGGTNLKLMKDKRGQMTSPMREVFSFDHSHVSCQVENNPEAFLFPSYSMGELLIEPNQFFMIMESKTVTSISFAKTADGKDQATIKGEIDCATYAGTSAVSIGSRSSMEPASFTAVAVDGGLGGGKAGDSFSIAVNFSKTLAPVQFAIFGPEATFTGKMITGEVTITEISEIVR